MSSNRRIVLLVKIAGVLLLGATLAPAQTIIGRSQLRRTTDPSPRSAAGTLTMIEANGKQLFQVNIKGLGQDQFGIFLAPDPIFTTNCCSAFVALLNRRSAKQGTWSRQLAGTGAAPPEFVDLGINNLTLLAGGSIDISQPGTPDIATVVTNVVGGVTNIVLGITNVVGGTTNVIQGILVPTTGQTGEVFSVLWAPLPPLTTRPGANSFAAKTKLILPPLTPPPSPQARGTINISFTGTSGRSVFDVRATDLIRGQQYTLWVADRTNTDSFILIPAGDLTLTQKGAVARFQRDTQFGDPLPQQVRDVGDLSGRIVEVRDGFFNTHLVGIIP